MPNTHPDNTGQSTAHQDIREVSLAAVVIRADGTREDLGAVSYWHKRRWRRALWRLRHG